VSILYLDTETTIKNRGEDAIGKHQASAFHPDNEMVWVGWEWSDTRTTVHTRKAPFISQFPNVEFCDLLVAQNVSFDLHHLMKYKSSWIEWCRTGKVWDVMLAEYLLTGQEHKWASLDELSTKYGGTVKDSKMKEYWEAGVCTSDIPDEEIEPYLIEDVANLSIIYKKQLVEATKLGMLPLIQSQMAARLATTVMEWNGMSFDRGLARTEAIPLRKRWQEIDDVLKQYMTIASENQITKEEFNPNSNKQLSAVLFGGELSVVRKDKMLDDDGNVLLFKSGLKKGLERTKNTSYTFNLEGIFNPEDVKAVQGKGGSFPVGDDVIMKLIRIQELPMLSDIRVLREYKKQLTTYFEGYSSLVFPDGCIHGSLNHCQTNTGRLSSSQPNLQNISNKESE
jgi:DNA polymerase I-like protein with 3'-5' exonuclease and polymerase domains